MFAGPFPPAPCDPRVGEKRGWRADGRLFDVRSVRSIPERESCPLLENCHNLDFLGFGWKGGELGMHNTYVLCFCVILGLGGETVFCSFFFSVEIFIRLFTSLSHTPPRPPTARLPNVQSRLHSTCRRRLNVGAFWLPRSFERICPGKGMLCYVVRRSTAD